MHELRTAIVNYMRHAIEQHGHAPPIEQIADALCVSTFSVQAQINSARRLRQIAGSELRVLA